MPYIRKSQREYIRTTLEMEKPGDLTFSFTETCRLYLERHGESYRTYNDILGSLECTKLELYRRKIAQYEDKKIKQNGDIW